MTAGDATETGIAEEVVGAPLADGDCVLWAQPATSSAPTRSAAAALASPGRRQVRSVRDIEDLLGRAIGE